MYSLARTFRMTAGLGLAIALFSACAPKSYNVKAPAPGSMKYTVAATPARTQLPVIDDRRGEDKVFSTGILPAALLLDKAPVDPPQFLAKYTSEELAARGLPVTAAVGGDGTPKIRLRTFKMINHRANGFSPFVTFTFISADLEAADGKKRIGVFVTRGKVPVWSFDEVVEPTLNEPLSIAVKEFASKVANKMYGYRASDAYVKELITKIGTRNDLSYLDVYALGFTNNPTAVDTLVTLTKDPDEYVRLAAIASLGNIGATSQLALLKSIYANTGGQWHDRAMAIKSIADLNVPEGNAFVNEESKRLSSGGSDKNAIWITQIVGLYQ